MTGLHLQHYSHFLQTTPSYSATQPRHIPQVVNSEGSEDALIENQFTPLLPELGQWDGTLHEIKL
jgi:hypothetical protein